jgi:hypothetical protein
MKYHTELHDVVQIVPHFDAVFGGCFATVTEVKDWGVVAYVGHSLLVQHPKFYHKG